jgi:Xaa-Pro aminopeptidase
MQWLANLSPHGDERPVMLIVSPTHAGFLMPGLNADSSRPHTDLPFYTWSDSEGPHKALAKLLNDTNPHQTGITIAIDEAMRADFALLVLDALPGAAHKFTPDTVGHLRAIKDTHEYDLLKANALLNDGAMNAAFEALKPGITEIELADIVKDFFKSNGAQTEFAIVCFGENGAFPHHHPGDRVLKANDCALIDIGGRSNGYPSDMTRVATLGEKPEGYDEIHAILETAIAAGVAAAKPGMAASQLDNIVRDVITKAGYGDNFLHRTGHGLGIDVHELPNIAANSDAILGAGNVFSIEPGIYLPGRFGIRLEDIVILHDDHAEILSELPREIKIIS